MAAEFVPAARSGLPHQLLLPEPGPEAAPLPEQLQRGLDGVIDSGALLLQSGDWLLTAADLRGLEHQLATHELELMGVEGRQALTLAAAAAIGLSTRLQKSTAPGPGPDSRNSPDLVIQRGTLRSGDHLQVEGTALVLGDVNPGARVSAGGHVLVWGRLRGVAHAGCHGDPNARIVALQLRPLQLRIAEVIARGPEDSPPQGFCEQARLVGGVIRIDPSEPSWPPFSG
ncbi:septum site-determining protein MinC [Synechococcus sp. EJ6-Ellesmere]|uniref:septum site-determining protein MinC n=1 Tax=Synechococcus sp. EJ6-Ellesmere TaxID=2823734 RepID=UPI0020CD8929|nr:septum site-determining protein MinC [Synechococcus sp. EJ6-Ellesmere]MCP9825310.1 septum site-determining protein MinC [Synechococcus sp. EJ6-Ellesmere]